jgi:hypothetical protein
MKTGSDKLLGDLYPWIYSFRKTGSNALLYARMKFILASYNAGPGPETGIQQLSLNSVK